MQIKIHHAAKKYLERLPPQDRDRIEAAIEGLTENPPKGDIKPYVGCPGIWRLKEGNFRILYEFKNDMLYISRIAPRGQAYTRETRNRRG